MPTQTLHSPGLIVLTAATQEVIDALRAAGGRPYLVGGCVRDALRHPGQAPKDIDIEVFGLDMDQVAGALAPHGHVDTVGQAFSVLKLRLRGEDFDVAVPRREVKTGPGHTGFAVVADPDATLAQATARRDFTINALLFDPVTQDVIDCWGGLEDLRAGILRHTSAAFDQDPLRVLRAVGFAARFGLTLAGETAALCRSLAGSFGELSQERVWGEWYKVVTKGTHLSGALNMLAATGWEAHFPELGALHGVAQDPTWHPEGDVFTHVSLAADKAAELADAAGLTGDDRAVVVLAALTHDFGKATHTEHTTDADGRVRITSAGHAEAGAAPAKAFLRRIGAPAHLISRVVPLVEQHMSVHATVSKRAVRRLARRLVPATMLEWALVVEADKGGRGPGAVDGGTAEWLSIAAALGTQSAPATRVLTGAHLIAAGLRPGATFKPILAAALEAQDEGVFDSEAGGVAWLTEHLAQGTPA